MAQPTGYYQASAYAPKVAYAPISATSSTPQFYSQLQHSASQAIAAAQSAPNPNYQYATQIYQPSYSAAKYGYTQIPTTAQKYFYASS